MEGRKRHRHQLWAASTSKRPPGQAASGLRWGERRCDCRWGLTPCRPAPTPSPAPTCAAPPRSLGLHDPHPWITEPDGATCRGNLPESLGLDHAFLCVQPIRSLNPTTTSLSASRGPVSPAVITLGPGPGGGDHPPQACRDQSTCKSISVAHLLSCRAHHEAAGLNNKSSSGAGLPMWSRVTSSK